MDWAIFFEEKLKKRNEVQGINHGFGFIDCANRHKSANYRDIYSFCGSSLGPGAIVLTEYDIYQKLKEQKVI